MSLAWRREHQQLTLQVGPQPFRLAFLRIRVTNLLQQGQRIAQVAAGGKRPRATNGQLAAPRQR